MTEHEYNVDIKKSYEFKIIKFLIIALIITLNIIYFKNDVSNIKGVYVFNFIINVLSSSVITIISLEYLFEND